MLAEAFARHPERFPKGLPQPQPVPSAVWINPPANRTLVPAGENTMTRESREVVGCVPGATVEAVFDRDPAASPNLKPEDLCMTVAQ